MSKSRFIGGFLAAFLVFATCGIAHAEQDEDSPFSWFGLAEGRSGFSSGMDITSTSQSNFGTLEVAPFGPPDKDGWRLRVYGAQATYSYRSDHTFSQMAKNE